MIRHLFMIALTLIGIQVHSSLSTSDPINLRLCMQNQTLNVQILADQDKSTCQCQAASTSEPVAREDYVHVPGVGSYKMHRVAKNWNEARKICNEEKANLAIINSKTEEAALLDIFKNEARTIINGANNQQAYLGIHDLFNEGEWLTIFGESLYLTGYSEWSTTWYGSQPDNADGNQNCGVLIINGGMDDVNCKTKFAFFCELTTSCGSDKFINRNDTLVEKSTTLIDQNDNPTSQMTTVVNPA